MCTHAPRTHACAQPSQIEACREGVARTRPQAAAAATPRAAVSPSHESLPMSESRPGRGRGPAVAAARHFDSESNYDCDSRDESSQRIRNVTQPESPMRNGCYGPGRRRPAMRFEVSFEVAFNIITIFF